MKGYYDGKLCEFTLKDFRTGKIYSDDIDENNGWVDTQDVQFVGESSEQGKDS